MRLSIDADGVLYVIYGVKVAVPMFSPDGVALGHVGRADGSIGNVAGEFWHPSGNALSADGTAVYVADTYNQRMQVFAIAPCAAG